MTTDDNQFPILSVETGGDQTMISFDSFANMI